MTLPEMIQVLLKRYGNTIPIVETTNWYFFKTQKVIGWLWVDEEEKHWNITLAAGRKSHNHCDGEYMSVDIRKDTGTLYERDKMSGGWELLLSVWPASKRKANRFYEEIKEGIEKAYKNPTNLHPRLI